ncbi:protein FAM3C [Clinocottus analis]|uniref:protein FAM3C n=1 Tax=Clinocottus analis TaxID=304258 RepID=UPI0035C03E75
MRNQAVVFIAAVSGVLLITWGFSIKSFDVLEKSGYILEFNDKDQIKPKFQKAFSAITTGPKCSLARVCPSDHFALRISSGAANVVGPKICFDGKIIMSNALNNVGPGLNIVVVNGKNGKVEKYGFLNMNYGNEEYILAFLKEIQPGMIVLVASFDDVTPKMTDDMREVFIGMGSTLIKSVKQRDSWVFVGKSGTEHKSLFEKQAVNDEKTNVYEEWPEMVELSGCIPRTPTD